ncbi:hypothetical protein ABT332_06365 [Saccharomonospora azurea]|uniref:hypothetical protein n=1 Tax=Saccharomonospora azurea TaxID=40988 RepID=UPI00332883A7
MNLTTTTVEHESGTTIAVTVAPTSYGPTGTLDYTAEFHLHGGLVWAGYVTATYDDDTAPVQATRAALEALSTNPTPDLRRRSLAATWDRYRGLVRMSVDAATLPPGEHTVTVVDPFGPQIGTPLDHVLDLPDTGETLHVPLRRIRVIVDRNTLRMPDLWDTDTVAAHWGIGRQSVSTTMRRHGVPAAERVGYGGEHLYRAGDVLAARVRAPGQGSRARRNDPPGASTRG